MKDPEIRLRISVIEPPVDVVFALQSGRSDLVQPTRSTGATISFDFSVRVRPGGDGNNLNFLGPYAQGTPTSRFVYVNSGTYAGDSSSCWSRRAKVPLAGIPLDFVNRLKQSSDSFLEACVAGKAKDGGPTCASVPLLGQGWRVVRSGGLSSDG